MKIKVVPFDSNYRCYCIHYLDEFAVSFKRFFKIKKEVITVWKRLNKTFTYGDDLTFLSFDHPVLFSNFDDAVEFAKTLNKEKIKEWIEVETKKYFDEQRRITSLVKSRYKTMEFEV